jgi:hypothetical protein
MGFYLFYINGLAIVYVTLIFIQGINYRHCSLRI